MSAVGGDWRNGPAYDYLDDIGVEKIAHEFLRRNDEYAADYALLSDEPADDQPSLALARWGLRFRGGPPHPCRSRNNRVAAACRSAPGAANTLAGDVVRRPAP